MTHHLLCGSLLSVVLQTQDPAVTPNPWARRLQGLAKSCDSINGTSCALLGLMFAEGKGVPRDTQRAMALFSHACYLEDVTGCWQSCHGGNALDCYVLASLFGDASRFPVGRATATRFLRKACAGGEHAACRDLRAGRMPNLDVPPEDPREDVYRRYYVNRVYDYFVAVPPGFVARSASPPSPQHGFVITLDRKIKATLWVDGSYNAASWSSLDEAVASHVDGVTARNQAAHVLERASATLDRVPAERVRVRYRDGSSGIARIQEAVLALHGHRVYSIVLDTSGARWRQDRTVLDFLIQAWRFPFDAQGVLQNLGVTPPAHGEGVGRILRFPEQHESRPERRVLGEPHGPDP